MSFGGAVGLRAFSLASRRASHSHASGCGCRWEQSHARSCVCIVCIICIVCVISIFCIACFYGCPRWPAKNSNRFSAREGTLSNAVVQLVVARNAARCAAIRRHGCCRGWHLGGVRSGRSPLRLAGLARQKSDMGCCTLLGGQRETATVVEWRVLYRDGTNTW